MRNIYYTRLLVMQTENDLQFAESNTHILFVELCFVFFFFIAHLAVSMCAYVYLYDMMYDTMCDKYRTHTHTRCLPAVLIRAM
jgi:hypothetical protein